MSLVDQLRTKKNLFLAWDRINRSRPDSRGLDGVTIKNFQKDLNRHVLDLQKSLKNHKTFQFKPLKGKLIPKDGQSFRALQISAVSDRLVQRAILNVIEKPLEKVYRSCSFGYRRGLKKEDAIDALIKARDQKHWYVLEADIIKFFDNVNRQKLLSMLKNALPDESMLPLLKSSLDVSIGNMRKLLGEFSLAEIEEYFGDEDLGIAQGSVLSPTFANVYLSNFDSFMLKKGYKLVRYADDFVILCKTKSEAIKAHKLAESFLKRSLDLRLHPMGDTDESKTRITHFGNGFDFLGYSFNHKTIVPAEKSRKKVKARIHEVIQKGKRTSLSKAVSELKRVLDGWGHSYAYCHKNNVKFKKDEMIKIFGAVDEYARKSLSELLSFYEFEPKGNAFRGIHWRALNIPSLVDLICDKKDNKTSVPSMKKTILLKKSHD